jgi:hypothetical protein
MMGTPAEEFLVKGSLVFSLIFISRPQYRGNAKLSTKSDQWPRSGSNNSSDVYT